MKKLLSALLLFLCTSSLNAQDTPTPPPPVEENPAASAEMAPAETPAPETEPALVAPVASPETEPAPYPTTKVVPKETKPKAPRVIPKTYGDTSGDVFIGQRTVIDRYAGWGWVRAEKDSWRKARWVMLEEKPRVIQAPGRFLGHPDSDNGTQYKLYGQWAPYKGYEPNFDVFVDVFQIKGFELIGPGEIPKMSPPRSSRGRSDSDGPYQRRAGVTR